MAPAKLELTWIGKHERPRLDHCALIEDPALSRGVNGIVDNMLIQGDNLHALAALQREIPGRVQCVYIDPPYNTRSAFQHYDDDVPVSTWLTSMRARLELLRLLLAPEGVIFISIDDSHLAHLCLLCDEVFGRPNFCGLFVWEKKKKPSFLKASMGSVTEFVVAYARDGGKSPPFIAGTTTAGKKYPLNNAGNGVRELRFPAGSVQFRCPDQAFAPGDMSEGNIVTELLDPLTVEGGRNVGAFRLRGEWRYGQAKINEIVQSGEPIVISKAPFRPNHIKAGGQPKKMSNLLSIANYGMSTYEDATAESEALFGVVNSFDYPKPEKLISTLIGAVTQPGDLVLDAFLGSGTTAAVAHKMGRRWIGIELGDHATTLCVPRLGKVVSGEDPGGITKAVSWKGGGGFRFYRLLRPPDA